jgi:peptide/nickel transport system substrate-binding protein
LQSAALLVAIAFFTGLIGLIPASAEGQFTLNHQSSFLDETKILHVLGEVKNESDVPMKDVILTASFRNGDGAFLGNYSRSSELRVINPGESSPFEILFLNQTASGGVANFTISVTSQQAPALKEKQLTIVSSNSRLDLLGTFYINALIRNEGGEAATNSIMIATLYDRNDNVLAIGKALAEAIPGSSDIPAGSDAAFGVAITEKSQNPKISRYSLVVDSDQYQSDFVSIRPTGPGLGSSSGGNQTSSCLIATAAFGSEFAPQVQELRAFRDSIALQTFAGANFMTSFNTWYYSFSPAVADYERESPALQSIVRAGVYPLVGILDLSALAYDAVALAGMNSEVGIVIAGLTASSLIGLVFFAPIPALLAMTKSWKWNAQRIIQVSVLTWLVAASTVVVASLTLLQELMMFGTGLLVLSTIFTVVILVVQKASRLRNALFSRN